MYYFLECTFHHIRTSILFTAREINETADGTAGRLDLAGCYCYGFELFDEELLLFGERASRVSGKRVFALSLLRRLSPPSLTSSIASRTN